MLVVYTVLSICAVHVLRSGDVIAADGIITKSSDLRVDESSHTGESDDVYKSTDSDPALYCGQLLSNSRQSNLAKAASNNTEIGKHPPSAMFRRSPSKTSISLAVFAQRSQTDKHTGEHQSQYSASLAFEAP